MTLRSFGTAAALALALALALAASLAHAQEAPGMMKDGIMVDAKGMTLYTFDRDTAGSGKSACNGQCAALWPPLMAAAADKDKGDWTVVTRDDGSKQWAYKGKPLYFYKPDVKAGDKTGDNFRDVWHVVK